MGSAAKKIFSDPLEAAVDPAGISNGWLKKIADPIGLDKLGQSLLGGGGGDAMSKESIFAALSGTLAAQQQPAADPNLKPFNRPASTPDTAESLKTDRRRSIASALRRRAQSSILTGSGGNDALGNS